MKNLKLNNEKFEQLLKLFEQELTILKPQINPDEKVSQIRELFHFMEQNSCTSIKDLNQQVANDFIDYLSTRPNERRGALLSNTYINKYMTSINNFLKFMKAEEMDVPYIKLRYKKKQERKLPDVLTPKEMEQLYSVIDSTTAIGKRDRCMLAIYFGCGLRKKEGIRLDMMDIDINKEKIFIKKSKNNRERYVSMIPKVVDEINEYLNVRHYYLPEYSSNDALFISERGNRISGEAMAKRMQALWSRVVDRYGNTKHVTLHTLRHSYATLLYKQGMKLPFIKTVLGHQTIEATELYVTLSNLNY